MKTKVRQILTSNSFRFTSLYGNLQDAKKKRNRESDLKIE